MRGNLPSQDSHRQTVLGAKDVLELQRLVREVETNPVLLRFVADIVRATRPPDDSPPIVNEYLRW